jgi:hypothetical protein
MRLYAGEENHVALFAAAEDFRVGFTPVRRLKMGSADIFTIDMRGPCKRSVCKEKHVKLTKTKMG